MKPKDTGYIHSIQSLGTLDGPGLRTVVFFQGCSLRCKFCHNVDTIPAKVGQKYDAARLVKEVLRNKAYWTKRSNDPEKTDAPIPEGTNIHRPIHKNGGVTLSGGDPLFQPGFTLSVCQKLKNQEVHIALDTNLNTSKKVIDSLLPYVDLWMVSLKHMDSKKHKDLTGVPNKKILESIKYLDSKLAGINNEDGLRIRLVIIPTMTDDKKLIDDIINFVQKRKSLELVELLPYTSIGRHKWIELYGEYPLDDIPDATDDNVKPIARTFKKNNIEILF
jgi:pyruvate formate lyase activating enzyme